MFAAILLAELTLFLGLTQTGSGDSTRLVGRVTQDSQPAAGAVVVATSDSDVRSTVADAHGRYAFMTLLPGVYRLSACLPNAAEITTVTNPRAVPSQPRLKTISIIGSESGSEAGFAELSAGIEYLANLTLGTGCTWR